MKILVLGPCSVLGLTPNLPSFSDDDHPSELVRSLVDQYRLKGHQVTVLKFHRSVAQVERFSGACANVILVPRRTRAVHLTPGQWRLERQAAHAEAIAESPDVVHAHWTYEYARVAIESGLPHVVTAHDVPSRLFKLMRPRYYWWPRLLQGFIVARRAMQMTAQSPYTMRCWQTEMGRKKPIELVPNPVAGDVFGLAASDTRDSHPPRIMACSVGFQPRKNVTTLLKAFALFRSQVPLATLTLFGDDHGPGEAASTWAEHHGLIGGVDFRGRADRSAMLKEIALHGTVFVHPAREESFGMVVAEAMAVGIPVVGGSNSGAVPWLIGKAGILCDIESPVALSEAIGAATKNPALRAAGIARVRELCDLPTIANSYLRLLEQTARSGR